MTKIHCQNQGFNAPPVANWHNLENEMKNRMIKKLAKSGKITMLRVLSRNQKIGLELVPVVHGAEMIGGEINIFSDFFGQRRWFEI